MDETRFWGLVALLGGIADEHSVRALEAELRPEEVEAFGEAVGTRVDQLLARRRVPESHEGDTAEWIAAAVIAAGREAFERELAEFGDLSPDDWSWSDAEVLLVAGFTDADDRADDGAAPTDDVDDALGLWLQWKSHHRPEGVTTAWDAEVEGTLEEPDDPAHGRVPASDPAWDDALAALAADPEFHRRRSVLGGIGLHLVVRDVDEASLQPWPSETEVQHVVLTLPAFQARLDHEARTADYLEAVVALVTSTQQNLGLEE